MQQTARMFPWEEIPDSNLLMTGNYQVTGVDLAEAQSSTNKLMYIASMQVEEPTEARGLMAFENFVIGSDDDPQAMQVDTYKKSIGAKRLKQMMKAAQIPLDPNPEKMAAAYKGSRYMIAVTYLVEEKGDYAGSPKNKINTFRKIGEMVPEIAKSGAANVAAAIKPAAVAPPVAPTPAAPAQAVAPAPPTPQAAPAPPAAAAEKTLECTICHQMVPISQFQAHVEACIKKAQAA